MLVFKKPTLGKKSRSRCSGSRCRQKKGEIGEKDAKTCNPVPGISEMNASIGAKNRDVYKMEADLGERNTSTGENNTDPGEMNTRTGEKRGNDGPVEWVTR